MESKKYGARYWEVIPDGKTVRSPLVYNKIVTDVVSVIGELHFEQLPDKIKFRFDTNLQATRKISKSCEYISLK